MRILFGVFAVLCGLSGEPVVADGQTSSNAAFGVVADIQYADKDEKKDRHYRKTLDRAKEFVAAMNRAKPRFVVTLGDHTDGQPTPEKRKSDVKKVADVLAELTVPLKIVPGNHDAASGKGLLTEAFGIKDFHYTFSDPGYPGWRFIVLDGQDAATYVISEKQISWFRAELENAKKAGERVICFCHEPLLKEASPRKHILANPEPVLKVMDEAGEGVIQAWICGHDHSGGYAFRKGVHHLTMPGMVETPDSTSYALIRLGPDRIVVEGTGRAPSCELPYGKAPAVLPLMKDMRKKEAAPLPEAA